MRKRELLYRLRQADDLCRQLELEVDIKRARVHDLERQVRDLLQTIIQVQQASIHAATGSRDALVGVVEKLVAPTYPELPPAPVYDADLDDDTDPFDALTQVPDDPFDMRSVAEVFGGPVITDEELAGESFGDG